MFVGGHGGYDSDIQALDGFSGMSVGENDFYKGIATNFQLRLADGSFTQKYGWHDPTQGLFAITCPAGTVIVGLQAKTALTSVSSMIRIYCGTPHSRRSLVAMSNSSLDSSLSQHTAADFHRRLNFKRFVTAAGAVCMGAWQHILVGHWYGISGGLDSKSMFRTGIFLGDPVILKTWIIEQAYNVWSNWERFINDPSVNLSQPRQPESSHWTYDFEDTMWDYATSQMFIITYRIVLDKALSDAKGVVHVVTGYPRRTRLA